MKDGDNKDNEIEEILKKEIALIRATDPMKEIQENLFEYFEDMDDKTFVAVVDKIVYHQGDEDIRTSKLAEKFLIDNGLKDAYLDYLIELKTPNSYFRRNPSGVDMIEKVKNSLLSVSQNRFRRVLSKSTPKSTPLIRLNKQEKKDLTMVIKGCNRDNDNLMEDEATTRSMFDKEEADELIAERKRLSELYKKVLKVLK